MQKKTKILADTDAVADQWWPWWCFVASGSGLVNLTRWCLCLNLPPCLWLFPPIEEVGSGRRQLVLLFQNFSCMQVHIAALTTLYDVALSCDRHHNVVLLPAIPGWFPPMRATPPYPHHAESCKHDRSGCHCCHWCLKRRLTNAQCTAFQFFSVLLHSISFYFNA